MKLIPLVVIALTTAYPVLAHVAVTLESQALAIASIACLGAGVLWPGLMRGSCGAWLAAVGLAIALAVVARANLASLPLYAPPVLIDASLAWLFGHTLIPPRVPLIESLVRLMHEPGEQFDPAILMYARRLTAIWAVVLALLAAGNLLLALIAVPGGLLAAAGVQPVVSVSRETWSVIANFAGYLIVGALFLAEFAYRQRRFPGRPYRNLFDFLRRAAAVVPKVL